MKAAARFAVPFITLVALSPLACGDKEGAKDASDVTDEGSDKSADGDDAKADTDTAGDEGDSDEPEDESGLPSKCDSNKDDVCLPSRRFAKKLCNGDYPTVAMSLFANGTPWTRAYLSQETNAWNASGGGSSNEKLYPDEEVIIIRYRKPKSDEGGIQVSGANGGYDAVRWDGMCVTLDPAELRFDPPPNPTNARLIWNRIEMTTRKALKKDETVRKAFIAYKRECKGVTVGKVSKACVKLDAELSGIIANYVRESGDSLPAPKKLPE